LPYKSDKTTSCISGHYHKFPSFMILLVSWQ
jgi:hypothetical protein